MNTRTPPPLTRANMNPQLKIVPPPLPTQPTHLERVYMNLSSIHKKHILRTTRQRQALMFKSAGVNCKNLGGVGCICKALQTERRIKK